MRKRRTIITGIAIVMVIILFISGIGLQAAAKKGGNFGEGLVCWLKFDEGSGITVTDSSGHGNDGILGGSFTNDAVLGSAVDLSHPYHEVRIESTCFEPVTGTIEIWVKIANPQNADIVRKITNLKVRTNEVGAWSAYGLRIRADGSVHASVFNNDPTTPGQPWRAARSPINLVTLDQWHHLAMRWDGSTVAVFVDGTLQDSTSYDPVPGLGLSYSDHHFLRLGAHTWWGPHWPGDKELIGQLDDFRFYGHARSDIEIFTDFITGGHKPAMPPGQCK
jgi:hypothetical protein